MLNKLLYSLFVPLSICYSAHGRAETFNYAQEAVVSRSLGEVESILLAFDKMCHTTCIVQELNLKEIRILESTETSALLWSDYAELVPTQIFQRVTIAREPAKTVISIARAEAADAAELQTKYGLNQKTSLDSESSEWILEEIMDEGGLTQTKVSFKSSITGAILQGGILKIVEKASKIRTDQRFANLTNVILPVDNTYYKSVKNIVDAHCVSCHQIGGTGPFALDTYRTVKASAGMMLGLISEGQMPPWGAKASETHPLKYDFSLSEAKIKAITDWVAAGKPEGRAFDQGRKIKLESAEITNFDHSLSMSKPHKTNAGKKDEYRCFIVDKEQAEDFYLTGVRFRSTNNSIVHHVSVYVYEPEYVDIVRAMDAVDVQDGYTCFGSPNAPGFENIPIRLVATSASNEANFAYPTGTGVQIKKGSLFVMQVHYHVRDDNDPSLIRDSLSAVDIQTKQTVDKALSKPFFTDQQWINGGKMIIPAGQEDVVHTFMSVPMQTDDFVSTKGDFEFKNGIYVHGFLPHQHMLGTGVRVWKVDEAGHEELLFDNVGLFNFRFQREYQFKDIVYLSPTDKLKMECHWNNSLSNEHYDLEEMGPPIDKDWGDSSTDEMCALSMALTEY